MKLRVFLKLFFIVLIIIFSLIPISYFSNIKSSLNYSTINTNYITPSEFINNYNLNVEKTFDKFNIVIPYSFDVNYGDYPIGLYFKLANEFSRDINLPILGFKGKSLTVYRYSLIDGLSGRGPDLKYKYPSKLILLVNNKNVVGAWYSFNNTTIGPSLNHNYIEQITGMPYETWLEKENLFTNLGENNDLLNLEPTDVIKAFCKAINDGNKKRALSCLTPKSIQQSLTMNLHNTNGLFHLNFNSDNSLVHSLLNCNIQNNFKILDPDCPTKILNSTNNITKIEVSVTLDAKWVNATFNGSSTKYIIMEKHSSGWKIDSIGTSP